MSLDEVTGSHGRKDSILRRSERRSLGNWTIPQIFALALAASIVQAVYVVFEARDLVADGSYYLLQALAHGGLSLIEPGRKTVEILQQSFSFAAYKLGVSKVSAYCMLFTLGVQIWPLLLTAGAWLLLPPNGKGWILGPLLNLVLFIPMTSFVGISGVTIASCFMWVLYFLVEFRMRSWRSSLVASVLAVASIYLHEEAFAFMVGIAVLSAIRAREVGGWRRAHRLVLSLLVAVAAFHLAYLVVFPRDAVNRAAFLKGIVSEFLVDVSPDGIGVSWSAVAAICVCLCLLCVHFPIRQSEEQRLRRVAACAQATGALFVLIALLFLFVPEWVVVPHAFMAARGIPIIATTAMAVITHVLVRHGWTPERLAPQPVRILLIAVIPLQLFMQSVLTEHWAMYRQDLAGLVRQKTGIIDWKAATNALDPNHTLFRRAFDRAWSIEPLSILLAPSGRIRAVVEARPDVPWRPYDLTNPKTLPLCARGLDWSRFLAARRDVGVRGELPCSQSRPPMLTAP